MKVDPVVTVVLSTYNRPDTLRVAIASVVRQTTKAWRLLVVGDWCDESTEKIVLSFGDRRISYHNLPARCGEQSGPNSVRIELTDTEFVAFLNQDDFYLPDHLQYGLSRIGTESADFFVGESRNALTSRRLPSGEVEPLFKPMHKKHRRASDIIGSVTEQERHTFEPVSSWIVRTQAARSLGHMKNRGQIATMSPISEWVARAWRKGFQFTYGSMVTVLKVTTHYQDPDPRFGAYGTHSHEHDFIAERFGGLDSDEIRAYVSGQSGTGMTSQRTRATRSWIAAVKRALRPVARIVYLKTGVNLFDFAVRIYRLGTGRKVELAKMIKMRTADELSRPAKVEELVKAVRASNSRTNLPPGINTR